NMQEIQNEVLYMMQPELAPVPEEGAEAVAPPRFGARDVQDLSWKNLLDAYTCTECGRCTAVCPANITGKKLSPRKIMMDIRDRTEEVSRKIHSGAALYIHPEKKEDHALLSASNFDDGLSLFDRISEEEI